MFLYLKKCVGVGLLEAHSLCYNLMVRTKRAWVSGEGMMLGGRSMFTARVGVQKPTRKCERKKCEHGSMKGNCKHCSGCPHGKLPANCKICNGCPHNTTKYGCKICNGCPHQRLKYLCPFCDSESPLFGQEDTLKSRCGRYTRGSICEHAILTELENRTSKNEVQIDEGLQLDRFDGKTFIPDAMITFKVLNFRVLIETDGPHHYSTKNMYGQEAFEHQCDRDRKAENYALWNHMSVFHIPCVQGRVGKYTKACVEYVLSAAKRDAEEGVARVHFIGWKKHYSQINDEAVVNPRVAFIGARPAGPAGAHLDVYCRDIEAECLRWQWQCMMGGCFTVR